MFHYQTRRMLQNDVAFLRQQLDQARAVLADQDGELGKARDRAGALRDDRQALVDEYWRKTVVARWARSLQLVIVSVMVAGLFLAGGFIAWRAGQHLAGVVLYVFAVVSLMPIVLHVVRMTDPETSLTLPSGEKVEVSPLTVDAAYRQMDAMSQA